MQPYFLPYLGYFDLIHCTDHWIVFDEVQYIKHGWVNRNRVLKQNGEWQYIIVPIRKQVLNTPINKVEISANTDWKKRIFGQIQHYKKKAPYFHKIRQLLEQCFIEEEQFLSRYNVKLLEIVCNYLGIQFSYEYFSEMDLSLGEISGPGDWAFEISKALGATVYVNPPGGEDIFDVSRFQSAGIHLEIRRLPLLEYQCSGYPFIPQLSILDVLMWNSPEDILLHLNSYDYSK